MTSPGHPQSWEPLPRCQWEAPRGPEKECARSPGHLASFLPSDRLGLLHLSLALIVSYKPRSDTQRFLHAWGPLCRRCCPAGAAVPLCPLCSQLVRPVTQPVRQVLPAPLASAPSLSCTRPSVYTYYQKGGNSPAVCHRSDNYIPNSHHAVCC